MANILNTRFGLVKHLLCGFVLSLACTVSLRADPVTIFLGTWYGALALSAALSAASFGLQMLFRPKVKPQDKGRLQGDIQFTSVGEDIPINKIAGSSLGDGIGGMKTGGIIIYASEIRKTIVDVPGGGGGGGGKGAPKAPPTREFHYFIDLAIMWATDGPYRIKQIKAQTDLLYQSFTPTGFINGTGYEAEDRTGDSANVDEVADTDMSGNLKVNVQQNEYIEWNNVACTDDTNAVEMYIVYKSAVDIDIELTVNGVISNAVLPNSFNIRQNVNLPQTLIIGSLNVVRIKNLTNATVGIDRIVVGFSSIYIDPDDPPGGCYLSGVQNPNWTNPEPTYDYMNLRGVYQADSRACEQYNYQANPNSLGEISANIVNNGVIRNYSGNQTQLPDPLLQEHFESLYGAGSTPAFRNRCYTVFDNFEITKYGTVPNFTAVIEHETINSLGELYADLSLKAGLTAPEFDFTDLDAVPLRGYAITQKEPPARTMELLNRFFDVDMYEDFDGKIVGVIPTETLAATIPLSELGSVELSSDSAATSPDADRPFTPVVTTINDDSDLPFFLDVSFVDPLKDYETRNVHPLRSVDANDRKANVETGVVFLESEAQKFGDRDLHKQYVEKDGVQVNLFHKYTWLAPTDLIQVADVDGSLPKMRIKAIGGWLPGALDVRGVSRDAFEYPPRLFSVANNNPVVPSFTPPAPIIGTFLDLTTFREEQTAGFYVAACVTDPHYVWAGAGLYRVIEGPDYEALDGIPSQATMGLTISGALGTLGDTPGGWVPGDWDDTNTLTLDLYYGELETLTDDQVLEGRNFLIVGNELIQFATATRDNGYPNRWLINRLRRGLRGTASTSHNSMERAVLFTQACRWIAQDPSLAGTVRTYKFVGSGGDLATASSVDFNWLGRTRYNTPIYNSVDNGIPILSTDEPIVSEENGYWIVNILRPLSNGFSANIAEIRVRRSGDDFVLRQKDIGNTVEGSVLATLDDSKVDYRWRNAFRLDGSDGWSAWSAFKTILAGSVPPPPPTSSGGGGGSDPGDINPVGGCFINGTLVLMADWTEKPIETISKGDFVMAWTPTGRMLPGLVAGIMPELFVNEYRDLQLTDDRLGVTETHPFAPEFNLKLRVKDMKPLQQLRQYLKGWAFTQVKKIKKVKCKEPVRVNNFEVATWHTYFVRGETGKPWKAVYNNKQLS